MEERKKLAVLITRGLDEKRSSVAWSIANGTINSDLAVTVFLTSSAVDWVRKRAADRIVPNSLDPPMIEMIQKARDNGCAILVCPPRAEVRGSTRGDLFDGVIITGSAAMYALVKQGAATLCF